jgi:hypothetical protein
MAGVLLDPSPAKEYWGSKKKISKEKIKKWFLPIRDLK